MRKFGVFFEKQEFEVQQKKGVNYYSVLRSRKEGNVKFYLLAFSWKNPYELVTVHGFLEEFFSRNQPLALSIILLGYDREFKAFSLSTKIFLKKIYSEQKLVKSMNFLRDGINLEIFKAKAKESAIFYYPYGRNANAYDMEYHDAFASKLDSPFVEVKVRMVEENKSVEKKLRKIWNFVFKYLPFLKITSKNLVLSSMKKMIVGNTHKPHQIMLDYGIDAFTLRLYLSENEPATSKILADYTKLLCYGYKLAESNERALEASSFVYSIVDRVYSIERVKFTEASAFMMFTMIFIEVLIFCLIFRMNVNINMISYSLIRVAKIYVQTSFVLNLPKITQNYFNGLDCLQDTPIDPKFFVLAISGLVAFEIIFGLISKQIRKSYLKTFQRGDSIVR